MQDFPGSPRTRGSTVYSPVTTLTAWGFPAHAGINRLTSPPPHPTSGVPRARGDQPAPGLYPGDRPRGSPRTRGSTGTARRKVSKCAGFPAHAGINRCSMPSRNAPSRVPRARGDQPWFRQIFPGAKLGSPRTRGSTAGSCLSHRYPGGFPAHAGINRMHRRACPVSRRVPRARGDQPAFTMMSPWHGMGSPRTRGSTAHSDAVKMAERGFPAHAGINRR